MNIRITPQKLSGDLDIIASKSISHRYLIAAALANGTSYIKNVLQSDDLQATKQALMCFGATFNGEEVMGRNQIITCDAIDCQESGSTLRFLVPVALLYDKPITFYGHGRLKDRPMDVYEELFSSRVTYHKSTQHALPLTVKGPIQAGTFNMRGDVSSQFVSGLLFALPLLNEDSRITFQTPLESRGYVDLTIDCLSKFGVKIHPFDNGYRIAGRQTYQPQIMTVEGDYSQAAFWMVAGTIGHTIGLYQLDENSLQGDRQIVNLIKQMGGSIERSQGAYRVSPTQTKGIEIDLSDIPDLGPILMVLAALSEGNTIFKGVQRLRYKESDRLQAMQDTLNKFGVLNILKDDQLIVTGVKTLKGGETFSSYQDHRIAMAIAIAAIRAEKPITLLDAQVISKSYPMFFEDYKKLGGILYVTG